MDQPRPQLLTLIDHSRAIKNASEITAISRGGKIISEVFEAIKKYIRPGMTELQLALFLEKEMKKRGVKELAFSPIVAAGKNSANIHHWPTKQKVQQGDQIMFDFGAVVKGYCSDMTRMLFLGAPTKKQQRLYNAVLRAQMTGVKKVRAGITGGSVDIAVRRMLKKAKLNSKFTHNLGHGVGRYIHEWPRLGKMSGDVLRSNMVVTVEPGIYIEGWGGIRIEDMVHVKNKGNKILTPASKDINDAIIKKDRP